MVLWKKRITVLVYLVFPVDYAHLDLLWCCNPLKSFLYHCGECNQLLGVTLCWDFLHSICTASWMCWLSPNVWNYLGMCFCFWGEWSPANGNERQILSGTLCMEYSGWVWQLFQLVDQWGALSETAEQRVPQRRFASFLFILSFSHSNLCSCFVGDTVAWGNFGLTVKAREARKKTNNLCEKVSSKISPLWEHCGLQQRLGDRTSS